MKKLILWLVLLFLLSIVGRFDYEDSTSQFQYYCKMVMEGDWPDYKNQLSECKK